MMVSKANSNEQTDADILQSKVDVLRARDIMPPDKKKTRRKPESQNSSERTAPSADAAPISAKKEKTAGRGSQKPELEKVKLSSDVSPKVNLKKTDFVGAHQEKGEIPKFDLAEDIMAEQRKVTAIKRKAPNKKNEFQSQEPEVESTSYTIEQPAPALSEQDKIITEIVARDIERLCQGG